MTEPEYMDLRARRRDVVAGLAATGLSTRQIAGHVGVSHVTVQNDLREAGVSTTPPAATTTRRIDDRATRVRVLVAELDKVGLAGQLADSRMLLQRADALLAAQRAEIAGAVDERDQIAGRLADGNISLADATARVNELSTWLAPKRDGDVSTGRAIVERAVSLLYKGSLSAAKRDAQDAHTLLSRRASEAVARAVEAGGRLIDVGAIVAMLRRASDAATAAERDVGSAPVNLSRGAVELRAVEPTAPAPVAFPNLTLEAIGRDPAAMAAWGEAADALAEFNQLHAAAGTLHDLTSWGASARYPDGVEPDRYALRIMGIHLPAVVHLAVENAMGWRPGLHLSMRPGRRAPIGADDLRGGTEIVDGVRMPSGWAPPVTPGVHVGPPPQH